MRCANTLAWRADVQQRGDAETRDPCAAAAPHRRDVLVRDGDRGRVRTAAVAVHAAEARTFALRDGTDLRDRAADGADRAAVRRLRRRSPAARRALSGA